MKTCRTCGATIATTKCEHCRQAAADARAEDVVWLLGTDTVDNVARRVGLANSDSLVTWCRRSGRTELMADVMRHLPGRDCDERV